MDLAAHAATGTGGVANIANLTGGQGDDTLGGDGNANTILGNGGNDVLSGGGGAHVLNGGAGVDRVASWPTPASRSRPPSSRSARSSVDTLSGIEAADLTGGASANTFDVSTWAGAGSLTGVGGNDTVAATKNANFVLTNASLTAGDGLALTLAGICTANLTGGAAANTFDVSGRAGAGKLTGGGGANTVAATKDADFNVGAASVVASDGLNLVLSAIGALNLTGVLGQHLHDPRLEGHRDAGRRRRQRHRCGDRETPTSPWPTRRW